MLPDEYEPIMLFIRLIDQSERDMLFAPTWLPEYDLIMNMKLKSLPVDERIQLVEDLWDSIAADQSSLPLTEVQKTELDRRLQAFELDGNPGQLAAEVIEDIRSRL